MSTPQRNDALVVAVDPSTADILRDQTLVVLEANHHYFEHITEFTSLGQVALSEIYRGPSPSSTRSAGSAATRG
jgi:hypothetical protein